MSVDTDRPGPGPRTSGARVRPAALPGGATVTCTVAARLVAEIRPDGDFPTVVTGDFNAEP
ncbi:hypothetical protein HCN52_21780, partial [Streptomyces bohaiensis]|nr:hypothetical protein [Streptomyces bohaiensis]